MALALGTTPPMQAAGFGTSYKSSAPLRVPSRGHGTQPGVRVPQGSGSSDLAPSTASHSASFFTSYSTSVRRRSLASSPTVSPEHETGRGGAGSNIQFFAPSSASTRTVVGFETSSRAGPPFSPFKVAPITVAEPVLAQAPSGLGMALGKPPSGPTQGLLSKALSLTELMKVSSQDGPAHAFFPDVNMAPLEQAQSVHPIFCQELVSTAYAVAARAHRGQKRKDGQDVIGHCLDVAKLLASMGLDAETVAAGLLHESMQADRQQQHLLEEFMPTSVVQTVERVNTISEMSRIYRQNRLDFGDVKFRRMLVAMEDVKAVLVKLADRVLCMRTSAVLPRDKQVLLANETLEVYSAVANRLGVWCLKAELEDLAFKILHPEEYAWLCAAVADRQDAAALESTVDTIKAAMQAHGLQVEDISGRPKNLWGIWTKLQKDGHRDLARIFDLSAIRVVVTNKHECYSALRALQSVYRCMAERSKDFIRDIRKPNGYQSLHETVLGEGQRPMEVQIRTAKMHYIAEYGFAAHWKYKESLDSEDEWMEKETQYKRWLTQHKLGVLDPKKVRPQGTSGKDGSLASLGVAHMDRVALDPSAVDPFLRNDRFRVAPPVTSEVSVLLRTQDGVDTRSFPLGTTAAALYELLGVNDLPGYALTVNSRLPTGEVPLRSGDLVQVVQLAQLLGSGFDAPLEGSPSASLTLPSPLSLTLPSAAAAGSFAGSSFAGSGMRSFGRGGVSMSGGPTRALRVGGF